MNELSPDEKELLRAARSALSPNEARIAAVRTMLDARVGASVMHAPGGGLAGQAASTVGAASWGAAHVIALSLLAAASVGGALVLASRHRLAHDQTPALAAPSVPAAGAVAGSALGERPALGPSMSAEQPSLTPAQLPEASVSSRPAHPARRRYRPIEEPQVASPPASAPQPSPAAQDSPPQADAPAAPAVQSPEVPDDSLAHEISLLRAARAALEAGDPQEALALLHRHARLWPQGVLAEERLATRVLALCALRRFAEARTAAHQLESVAPHSPHLARVRASCAGDPATGAP
jgi:hypothetical protein